MGLGDGIGERGRARLRPGPQERHCSPQGHTQRPELCLRAELLFKIFFSSNTVRLGGVSGPLETSPLARGIWAENSFSHLLPLLPYFLDFLMASPPLFFSISSLVPWPHRLWDLSCFSRSPIRFLSLFPSLRDRGKEKKRKNIQEGISNRFLAKYY